jgi:hypothetical protein
MVSLDGESSKPLNNFIIVESNKVTVLHTMSSGHTVSTRNA